MVLEAFMVLLGAGATMAAGIPIAVRLARAGFSDADVAGTAGFGSGRAGGENVGFTPLDLGPDPMQWPSAKPWPRSGLPVPDWPSKGWDDEHFGQHWHQHGTSQGAPVPPPQRSATPAEAQRVQRQQAIQQKAQQERSRRDAQRRAEQEEAQRRVAARQALEQRQAARSRQQAPLRPATKAQPEAARPTNQPPGREELLHLVDAVGLAGTVQEIMKRTGWDFRKAAQYLARVRSGG